MESKSATDLFESKEHCSICRKPLINCMCESCFLLGTYQEKIDHPDHYGGKDNPYEAIKVIEAWNLGFCLGNTLKYICRIGKKNQSSLEDLKKARWYIDREINRLESDKSV